MARFGLVLGDDDRVAAWAFRVYRRTPTPYQRAVGVADAGGNLVGAALLQNYNGHNVELSYYGVRTLSLGIARALARIGVSQFNPSRVTLCISKQDKSLSRALSKPGLGFKLEGAQRCYYGPQDAPKNTALRFVMFRDRLDRLAAFPKTQNRTA